MKREPGLLGNTYKKKKDNTHHLACPGLSASEEHLLTNARTGPKRRSEKQHFLEHLQEKEEEQTSYFLPWIKC